MTMAQPTRVSRSATAGVVTPAQPSPPVRDTDDALLVAARQAQAAAYAPYSGFRVGAAIRTASGNVYSGCNVENASYGLTVCAERVAAFTAVAAEGPVCEFVAVAISADAGSCAPCGACRQVLAEFGSEATATFLADGRYVTVAMSDLLPYQFSLRDGPQ